MNGFISALIAITFIGLGLYRLAVPDLPDNCISTTKCFDYTIVRLDGSITHYKVN